jgi:hypothetical protein
MAVAKAQRPFHDKPDWRVLMPSAAGSDWVRLHHHSMAPKDGHLVRPYLVLDPIKLVAWKALLPRVVVEMVEPPAPGKFHAETVAISYQEPLCSRANTTNIHLHGQEILIYHG